MIIDNNNDLNFDFIFVGAHVVRYIGDGEYQIWMS